MKNKKLLVVLIALVMVFSVVLSAYIPVIDATLGTSNASDATKANKNFVDVTDSYTRAFDESLFAEGVLTSSAEMAEVAKEDRFGANEEVWVVIELEGDSLVSKYNNSKVNDFASLTDYVLSDDALQDSSMMLVQQNTLMKALSRADIDVTYKYSYTSMLNGFAAKVKYGDIAKIEAYSAVKDVIVSEFYNMPEEAVVNEVDVYDTGIFDSSDSPYKGEGMVVAVLDTGIEYGHEVFSQTMEGIETRMDEAYVAEKLATLNAYSIMDGNLSVDDVYYSAKLPFSFDYSDKDINAAPTNNPHGVHVSGIIGGLSDTITGVAPNAQILGMKVFSDYHSGAYTIDILAALEDCILLNVDVINMSLGSDGGFQTVPEGNRIGELYDQLRTAGITMMVAAGNSYTGAMGSAFGNTALTSNPDYGIMSSPASYSTTTAVASINGQKDEYISANNGETIAFFDNASNAASREYDFYDMLEKKLKENPHLPQFENGRVTLDYITIPGLGYLFNYTGIDVTDKVVLVARGVCTFQEKALAANTVGALAIIIYNNTTGVIRMSIGNELDIPACSINKESGDAMAKHATGTITLDRNNLAGPFMSDFSSWGALPNLTLDPDISGHGGNILSSISGNQYAYYSGTSMATPNLAGVAAIVRQYLQETRPELTKADITGLCNQLLMSTSTIAKNEKDKPVSPRKQGSGLAYLEAALNTQAYLTVDGSEFTKISLYDDPEKTGVYEFSFNLVNWGTSSLSYKISADVMSETFSWVKDYEKWALEEDAYMINDSTIVVKVSNGTYANDIVTVSAGQTAVISVSITLSEETKAYLNQLDEEGNMIFENGTYVEGFVRLDAQEATSYDLSIPYMAFFGDWLDAPLFDHDYYEVKASENDPTLTEEEWLKATTYNTTPLSAYYLDTRSYVEESGKNTYLLPMGAYIYGMSPDETPINPDPEYAAISMYTYKTYGIYNVYLGLLRSAKTLDVTISDYYTGKIVKQDTYNNVRKSIGQRPSFVYDATDWEANSDELILDSLFFYPYGEGCFNNSKYLVTIEGAIDYENGDQVSNNVFAFEFYVDYETPVVTEVNYRMKENKNNVEEPYTYYADITVYDNHYAQCVMIGYIPEGGEQIHTIGYPTPVRGERNSSTTVEVDITDYIDKVDEYDSFFIIVGDYAMNEGYYRVTLPRNITDLTINEEDKEITLNQYQSYTVTPNVTPADQWASGLVWTSSDETVAKVSDEGVIYAVGEGDCTITITDKSMETIDNWEEYENYQYYDEMGAPQYFILFGEEGTPLFSNATFWNGSVTINVHVDAPEGNRYKEVNPKELKIEGYNYVRAFERDLFGVNFNLDTVRTIGSMDIYPNEIVNIKVEAEPWNLDLSKYQLVWASSNESIATVDQEGNVTAVKEGTVTISVKLQNIETGRTPVSTSTLLEVSDPFVISNYILTKYYGVGDENGVVELPTDEYYNAIAEFAFCYTMKDREDEYDEETNYQYYVGNSEIKKVIIPEGIESIGAYAFYNCTSLETVVLPSTRTEGTSNYLSTIDVGAFRGCTSLKNINIGNPEDGCAPVAYLGAYAFADCTSLMSINLTPVTWMETGAFMGCTKLAKVDLPLLRIAGQGLFYGCSNLTDVILYEDTVIGAMSFAYCTKLTTISIPMTSVPYASFVGCERLRTVKFTGAIDEIGEQAFVGCINLTSVSFLREATLTNVGPAVFYGCTSLTKFDLNTNNTTLTSDKNGAIILNSDGTEFVLIAPSYNMQVYNWANSSVTTIGKGVFSARTDYISELDLSASKVETIEDYAFFGSSITTVKFPSTLKTIGNYAFYQSSRLTSVTIPDGVVVGDYAFAGCSDTNNYGGLVGLETATIGKNVTLGEGAFFQCQNLKTVNLPTDKSVDLGFGAFAQCIYLSSIDLTQFEVIPDYAFNMCLSLSNLDFSATKKIGENAFATQGYGASYTEIDLSNVEEIGARAFYGNVTLQKVTLGENLKVIPDYAFALCINLSEINLNNVEEIGEGAFYNNLGNVDTSTGYIFVNGEYTYGIRSLSLDNCKKIALGAFASCPWLETVYAPVVEEIGDSAFAPVQSVDDPVNPTMYVMITKLNSVDLGTTERDITLGAGAFINAENLETVKGLENVVTMGDSVFANCTKLTEVNMPKLTTVGNTAFFGCTALTTANVSALVNIGDSMFEGCELLANLTTAEEVVSIGARAFAITAIDSFKLTSALTFVGEGAFYNTPNLKPFTSIAQNNLGKDVVVDTFVISENYFVEEGMLYKVTESGGYELLCIPAQKDARDVVVKEGTVRIAYGAAYGNQYMRQLELPMSLKAIAPYAFDNNSLSVVVFKSYRMPNFETEAQQYIYSSVHSNPEFVQINDNIVNYYGSLGIQYFYPYYNFAWMTVDIDNLTTTLSDHLTAIYPTNGVSYNSWIFQKMFKFRTEGAATLDDPAILAQKLMSELPSSSAVKLTHKDQIEAARAAYDLVSDATQRNLLSSLYSNLNAAEKRLAMLMSAGEGPQEPPVDPGPGGDDPTIEPDDPNYQDLYQQTLNANKSLTTVVWVLAVVAVLLAVGFVLYVFVFSKKTK